MSRAATGKRPIFNVQKHAASRLHYDFRLEIGPVLKSWAIPKGPSLDPSVKRLAVAVDDHDLAYADFEGLIEEGQYGAGPVLLWDTGWFEPAAESAGGPADSVAGEALASMLRRGALDIVLHGHRLKGRFTLVQMKGRPGQWLLVKQRDGQARSGHEITDECQTSILTGRTIRDLEQEREAGRLRAYRCGA